MDQLIPIGRDPSSHVPCAWRTRAFSAISDPRLSSFLFLLLIVNSNFTANSSKVGLSPSRTTYDSYQWQVLPSTMAAALSIFNASRPIHRVSLDDWPIQSVPVVRHSFLCYAKQARTSTRTHQRCPAWQCVLRSPYLPARRLIGRFDGIEP